MARSHQEDEETPTQQQPPRRSLQRDEETEFDLQYFQQEYERQPQQLFNRILRSIAERDTYQQENERLRSRVDDLLIEKEELIAERSELRETVINNTIQTRGSIPGTTNPDHYRPYRSTKLPDPPTLTDGNDPKFEDWLTRIKDKLLVNTDHYPTDQIQRVYVIGRIGGEAATYITPRLRPDSSDPYQTVADLYQYLTDIYEDPNRVYVAKDDFRKLYIKKQEPFHTFYSTFTRITNEAQISPAELKYELNHKLPFDLQKQVLREFRDNSYTLKLFADYYSITDQTLKGIEERQTRTKRPTEKNQTNAGDRQATLPPPSLSSFRPQ